MKVIINFLGILVILASVFMLIYPNSIYGWIEANLNDKSLYITGITGRLIFGLLLIIAAKKSKYPNAIKFFGYLSLIVGIILLFMGHERFIHFFSSFIPAIKPFAPVSGFFGVAIGSFLIYAFSRNKE